MNVASVELLKEMGYVDGTSKKRASWNNERLYIGPGRCVQNLSASSGDSYLSFPDDKLLNNSKINLA